MSAFINNGAVNCMGENWMCSLFISDEENKDAIKKMPRFFIEFSHRLGMWNKLSPTKKMPEKCSLELQFFNVPPYVDRNAYFCHNINFYTNKQRGSDIVVSWLPTNEGRGKKSLLLKCILWHLRRFPFITCEKISSSALSELGVRSRKKIIKIKANYLVCLIFHHLGGHSFLLTRGEGSTDFLCSPKRYG